MSNSCDPVDCSLPGSSIQGILQARILSGFPFPSPEDLPNPGTEPRSPSLQEDSLPSDPPGEPKSTRASSLSLLQGIFPIRESNPGLPHCRRILCQLSHQRSPRILEWVAYSFSRGSSQPGNRTGVYVRLKLIQSLCSVMFSSLRPHGL